MDRDTLIAAAEFSRGRLLAILETIEKSGQDANKVLAWRPGPGRAHIAWQAMHCGAATHDRYLNVGILKAAPKDEALVASFAGGSTPSDSNIPSLGVIRDKLATTFDTFKTYIARLSPADLQKKVGQPGKERTIAESVLLLGWHEAHHQGQIHLTWNLYKGANGIA